jgi:uncharacterized membrane protein YeaQ/YmgE (transglycosylase-associated protein family)
VDLPFFAAGSGNPTRGRAPRVRTGGKTVGILTMIVIGLVAGLIARAIVPGRQAMGMVATMLLGIVGSFVGGLLGSLVSGGDLFALQPSGLIWSIIGSVIVLLIVGFVGRRRAV